MPRRVWLAFGGVLLVFAVIASVVAIKTPAWESADEPGHVQNIESLVSGHWYGIPSHCSHLPQPRVFDCAGTEPNQAPLYYLGLAAWQKAVGISAQSPYRGRSDLARIFIPRGPELMGDHGADQGFILWLRFPNIVMGVLTLVLTFFAVRLITSDPWTPVVAMAILASIPRFVFLSAFVTNDNLVNLLGAGLAYVALKFVLTPNRWRMTAVGAVFGLMVTTKLSALPMGLVIIALALLVAGWKRRAELAAIGFGSALAVSSWYLIQNTVRYGDPLAANASSRYLAKVAGLGTVNGAPYVVTDPLQLVVVQVPRRIAHSLWYQSGWGQFQWPGWVDWTITVGVLCILAGLIGRHVRRDVLITLATLSIAALLCVWVIAFETATYQARYAFGGGAALAGLLALAVERWRPSVRFMLPLLGLVGVIIAVQTDVLAVQWT
jgi:hypothetical protein